VNIGPLVKQQRQVTVALHPLQTAASGMKRSAEVVGHGMQNKTVNSWPLVQQQRQITVALHPLRFGASKRRRSSVSTR
jgi:hypothetical protein